MKYRHEFYRTADSSVVCFQPDSAVFPADNTACWRTHFAPTWCRCFGKEGRGFKFVSDWCGSRHLFFSLPTKERSFFHFFGGVLLFYNRKQLEHIQLNWLLKSLTIEKNCFCSYPECILFVFTTCWHSFILQTTRQNLHLVYQKKESNKAHALVS